MSSARNPAAFVAVCVKRDCQAANGSSMPARNVMFVVIAVAGGRVESFIAFFSIEGDDLFERMCRFHASA
jgi:hypothetical protein